MNTYLYELHVHTKETSACACSSAQDVVKSYHDAGYAGIITTDHFFNGNSTVPRDLSWDEKVELFCKGFENAEAYGKTIGMNVFFGFEFSSAGSDFIILGLDKQWLLENGDMMSWSLKQFLHRARKAGAYVIQAHPFRNEAYIEMIKLVPDETDAVEVYNACNREKIYNERARWYAQSFSLPMTCGTDLHNIQMPVERRTGVAFKENPQNARELISLLRSGEYEMKYNDAFANG